VQREGSGVTGPAEEGAAMTGGVLVTDFDGTLTRNDFYRLTVAELLPAGVPDYWTEYRAGRITHFEALAGYFAHIDKSEAEVLAAVDEMGLSPGLADDVDRLARAGWRVVVASAGCEWYIHRLLSAAGVAVEVHANRGRFEPGRGLRMELPTGSPFFSPTHGIDKAAVVRTALTAGSPVAFAGDGYPDEPAARLVPPAWRFARADLAEALTAAGEPFRPFDAWSEVAAALVGR
jgi:2,3-diketo-5-methylthio-1-phosphopentane phosphatase